MAGSARAPEVELLVACMNRREPPPVLARLQMLVQGAVFIAGGVALAPLGAVSALRPKHRGQRLMQYARYAAYGVGLIATATGQGLYEEYKTIHGR